MCREKNGKKILWVPFFGLFFMILIFFVHITCSYWIDLYGATARYVYDNGTERNQKQQTHQTSHEHLRNRERLQHIEYSCATCFTTVSLVSSESVSCQIQRWRGKMVIKVANFCERTAEAKAKEQKKKCSEMVKRFSLSIVSNILSFKLQMMLLQLDTTWISMALYHTSLDEDGSAFYGTKKMKMALELVTRCRRCINKNHYKWAWGSVFRFE